MRTYVYIDGFNFYYGVIKGTAYKWLDIDRFCRLMLPKNQVDQIKYFTALVRPHPSKPGQQQRQKAYLRALQTLPNVTIYRGHFLSHPVKMPLAQPLPGQNPMVTVVKTEEKGSDVNLATHLLWDAVQDRYDVAVVISNDSDLLEPIRIVRGELGKTVGIVNPHTDKPSQDLMKNCDFYKTVRAGVLAASQFPTTIVDVKGAFNKPVSW